MTFPTTSIRGAVKQRLIDLLEPTVAGTDIEVSLGLQAAFPQKGLLILGAAGNMELMRIVAGRKWRKDEFRVHCWIMAGAPGASAEETESQALDILAYLENVCADNPLLGNATLPNLPGVTWAGLEEVNGPMAEPTKEGFVSYIDAYVLCHAELH